MVARLLVNHDQQSITAAERDQADETTTGELLAQNLRNDAAYLMPSVIEKVEWVADLISPGHTPPVIDVYIR